MVNSYTSWYNLGMENIPHGTDTGYDHHRCRCDECRKAHRVVVRARTERRRLNLTEEDHGKVSSYQHCGCRCELCKKAWREYMQWRRDNIPGERESKNKWQRTYRHKYIEKTRELWRETYHRAKERDPEGLKQRRRETNLRKKAKALGVDVEVLRRIEKTQNGRCAICGSAQKKKSLSVDHCHKTGRVRGMLCQDCNFGLGKFKDSPTLLQTAISYLEGYGF